MCPYTDMPGGTPGVALVLTGGKLLAAYAAVPGTGSAWPYPESVQRIFDGA